MLYLKHQKLKTKKESEKQHDKNKLLSAEESLLILTADFVEETLQARSKWHDIFKWLAERKKLPAKNTLIWQGYHSHMKEKELSRQENFKGVHHQPYKK